MTPASPAAAPDSPPHWRDIDWTQHEKTAQVSGLTLNYVDYGAGDVVLLVHGLGGSWQSWLENIPTLGVNHRVIAVDLPGFGRSGSLPDDGDVADHIEALTELIDCLRIKDVVMVGHSLGGLVTLCTAMWKSNRVRGLILVSGGGVELSPLRLALIVAMMRMFSAFFRLPGVARTFARWPALRRILLWPALADWRSMSPEMAAIQFPLLSSPGFVSTARAAAAALPCVRADLIAAPALLIWGRRDRILPLTAARTMAAEMSDTRLVVLDNVGHCAMFEAPAAVNHLLCEFLDAHRAKTTPRAAPHPVEELTRIDAKEGRHDQRAG